MKALVIFGFLLSYGHALHKSYFENGFTAVEPFIVGGMEVEQGELPYQLALLKDLKQYCGASLVEVQGVLVGITAAHCTSWEPVEGFTVIGGDVSFSDSTGLEQRRNVSKVVAHDRFTWDENSVANDIAIIFFDKYFEENENLKPIPLPNQGQNTTRDLTVSGWGAEREFNSSVDILRKVVVPVVDHQHCQQAYLAFEMKIDENILCAGYLGVGGKDACTGDSGGPAVSADGGYLAGVVSYGAGCADPMFPGVYTEVSYYIDWINKTVAEFIQETNMKIPL